MSNFTPGPWHYQQNSDPYTHIVRDAENRYVCGCSQDSQGNAEGNARLIAAAPEMLEALKVIRESAYRTVNLPLRMAVIAAIAEDAILKAELNLSEGERRQLTIDRDPSEEPQPKKGKS